MGWTVEQGKVWRALRQRMDHSGDKEGNKCPSHLPVVGESKVFRKDEHPDWPGARGRASKQGNLGVGRERRAKGLTNWGQCGAGWEGSGKGGEVWKELPGRLVIFGKSKLSRVGTGWRSALWDTLESRPNQPFWLATSGWGNPQKKCC